MQTTQRNYSNSACGDKLQGKRVLVATALVVLEMLLVVLVVQESLL